MVLSVQFEPEVRAVAEWTLSWPFVISANLHEGDLVGAIILISDHRSDTSPPQQVANYPFDESVDPNALRSYAKSPDDATFR